MDSQETQPSLVWYAAYGSNVCEERFLCYIRGGTPPGSQRNYVGCHDKSLPRDARPILIPHRLFFAGKASGWCDKAMAFIRSAGGGQTFGRMYLITFAQFDQLIQQEQGVKEPSDALICPPLSYIAANKFCFTNPASPHIPADPKKRLSYGRILNLGSEGSHPILTFTAVGPDHDITVAEPSCEYLQTISSGIRETFADVTIAEICSYFLECEGVRDKISKEKLGRWLGCNPSNQFTVGDKGLTDMNATRDKDKYDACVRALQFELEQFWKRSLFFWGFIGAAFVAYATSESHPSLQAAIASFGFVCSVVWTLANRGSKFWYEDWERHLKAAEPGVTGSLYGSPGQEDVEHNDKRSLLERIGRRLWTGKRYSPSKLAIALSDYLTIFWFCILTYRFVSLVKGASVTALWPPSKEGFAMMFVAVSFVFAILLRWLCHTSKD